MAICPQDTELNCICIGGQLDVGCCDDAGNWPALRVTAELVTTQPGPVIDPTNCAVVVDTRVTEILEGTNGCWCTCPLKPNFHPDDPNLALQPSGSYWKITVQADNGNGSFTTVLGPIEVAIDATMDIDSLSDDCCKITGPCGDCVNLVCLMDPVATNPPTNRFCEAVTACLAPITGAGLLAGNVTGNYADGWVISLSCEDIAECIPTYDLVGLTTNGQLVFQEDGVTKSIHQILSTDPGQLITQGSDGGLFLECMDVLGCVYAEYVAYDPAVHDLGAIEGDGSSAAPFQIPLLDCDDIASCVHAVYVPFDPAVHTDGTIQGDGTEANPFQIPLNPDLTITTDGTTLGVTQDPASVDIVVTDPDPANVLSIGPNGGSMLTCEDIHACFPVVTDTLMDPATGQLVRIHLYDDGTVTHTLLDGTPYAGDPLTLICPVYVA